MIVVAIIGILASVALPAYNDYMQKSANGACLAEAKAYVNAGIASAFNGDSPSNFTASACASGPNMTIANYQANASLTYVPLARGSAGQLKNTRCDAGTGSCRLL